MNSTLDGSAGIQGKGGGLAKRVGIDKWLFGSTLLLVVTGVVMVFSASAVMASERFGSPYHFLLRQLGWALAGLVAMTLLMRVDYRRWKHPALVFTLLGLTTLLLVAVFFLDRSHNTHRWIRMGVVQFQPSELAKLALILFLAFFLESRTRSIDDWRHTLLPAVIPAVLFAGLIVKQPDLGTALVCLVITASILYIAGMRLRYFAYSLVGILPVLYYLLFHVGWRRDRMLAFLDPYADPQGRGFHVIQSLIAVGTGGVTGMGLMEGKQKLFYLPEPHTDFIYAVVSEELGLIGAVVIVVLFSIFAWRGFRAAVRTRDLFGRYLATGITAMIVVQAFFNISVVLALLPTKGIPLPFISYGGSSLFVMLVSVGVLLNISQQAE
jgi:cell division protein FtsW